MQHTDFEEMSSNWSTKAEFQDFVGTFPSDGKYRKEKFVDDFFKRAKDRFHKHFCQWKTKHLHLMLAGEAQPATYLACWLVNRAPFPFAPTYKSAKHHTNIHLPSMFNFLTEGLSPLDYTMESFYREHLPAIEELAAGKTMRDKNASVSM